jgi:hypothetical protein
VNKNCSCSISKSRNACVLQIFVWFVTMSDELDERSCDGLKKQFEAADKTEESMCDTLLTNQLSYKKKQRGLVSNSKLLCSSTNIVHNCSLSVLANA